MCGRYTLTRPEEIVETLGAEVLEPLEPRYNIAPTQEVPIVRRRKDTGAWAVANVRWGLVPFWARDPSIGNRMINARAETAASKPAFRDSFAYRRCIVLADGFFEWAKTAVGKQPYHVRRPDLGGLLLAGLWARWRNDREHKPLDTFTIVTTAANAALRPVHDRMPAILDRAAATIWLDREADPNRLAALLRPAADDLLELVPVASLVGDPANDLPACVERIEPDELSLLGS